MLRRLACFIVIALLLVGAKAYAVSPTWVAYATVSSTAPLVANRICYSDGKDILCDTSAPTLGGVGAGGDRITSGTQAVSVNQTGGVVSLSTAGTDWGYLHPTAYSYLPNLMIQNISATGVISTTSPMYAQAFYATGRIQANDQFRVPSGQPYSWGDGTTQILGGSSGGKYISFRINSGQEVGRFGIQSNGQPGFSVNGPGSSGSWISATMHVSGTALISSNTEVQGEVSASTIKLAANGTSSGPDTSKCASASDYGRIVYSADKRPYICLER